MNRFQRLFLWWSSATTAVSGLSYGWMKYLLKPAQPWAAVNHPLEPWMLKLHILTAPLMIFSVGLIASNHIWRHWKSRLPTGRRTGVLTGAAFGPLVLTGYLIQAVTVPWALEGLTWIHVGLGLSCTAGLFMHRLFVRRRRAPRPGRLPVVPLPPAQEQTVPSTVTRRGRWPTGRGATPVDARSGLL